MEEAVDYGWGWQRAQPSVRVGFLARAKCRSIGEDVAGRNGPLWRAAEAARGFRQGGGFLPLYENLCI